MAAMAQMRTAALPVVDGQGRLLGVVEAQTLRRLIVRPQGVSANSPVSDVLVAPKAVLPADAAADDASRLLAETNSDEVFIIDPARRLLGVVYWHDLIAERPEHIAIPGVGGMATPFGVYLVAGALRSGSSIWGLLIGGLVLGLMIAVAYTAVGAVCWIADDLLGTRLMPIWLAIEPPPGVYPALSWLGIQALVAAVFLFILRASPLTRYHGAEHQAVHALERGEPLTVEVVSRMPRVHPRCGTNILAAVAIFGILVMTFAAMLPGSLNVVGFSALAAVITLRTWRAVGAWLQQYATTRTPTPAQLAVAIRAAEGLKAQYLRAGPRQPSRLLYLWNAGVIPVAIGVAAGLGLPLIALNEWLARLP